MCDPVTMAKVTSTAAAMFGSTDAQAPTLGGVPTPNYTETPPQQAPSFPSVIGGGPYQPTGGEDTQISNQQATQGNPYFTPALVAPVSVPQGARTAAPGQVKRAKTAAPQKVTKARR